MGDMKTACRAILEKILSGEILDARGLAKAKFWACRGFGLPRMPTNAEILAVATKSEREGVTELLQTKPVRSISGVSIITVMTKPWPCPHGKCTFCPGGPTYGLPESYTGREPAAMRAIQHGYDPRKQVESRIEQLRVIGHPVDKVELIVLGGTLLAMSQAYLERFVCDCLNALTGAGTDTIEDAQKAAESAPIRNVGITLETRPDYCKTEHVDQMLRLGATRVELGVQTIYDDVYELVERSHRVEDVVEATRIAKDSGLAVIYHMMPGLPGSSFDMDLKAFLTLFEDSRFMPDMLKIYPCLVIRGTKLHDRWRAGEFEPMSTERAVDLILKVKQMLPRWVRVQRIQRDIPANLIEAGVRHGNLGQLVYSELERRGLNCRCIRCREVGHVMMRKGVQPEVEDIKLSVEKHEASGGQDIFLSFEDFKRDILIGFLRLRIPSERAHRAEVVPGATVIRELHVFGPMVPVGEEARAGEWQHRGWGEALLAEAERISREEFDARKLMVLSGIGVRDYYRRFGYEREGPYMAKRLG